MTDEQESIREKAIVAIAIMDERGRSNPEGNSRMLWNKYWQDVRELLAEIAEANSELIWIVSDD